jgi:Trypsin-like peptidase domain
MKQLVLAILLFVLLVLPATAQVQQARGFDKQVMDATFVLYGQRDDPISHKHYQPFLCTAFIFQQDATGYLLMSAGHCVDGSPVDGTFAVAEQMGGPVTAVTAVSARLTAVDDYAVFHLTTTKKYPVLELGDDAQSYVGEETINPNFAFGLVKQVAHGVISSQVITVPDECSLCANQFAIHEQAGPGASGSPVISATTHKVIGLLRTTLDSAGFGVEPISVVKAAMLAPNQYDELHKPHEDVITFTHTADGSKE